MTQSLANWSLYGFSHFNEVIVGCITTLAAMKLANRPPLEISKFAVGLSNYFANAVDPQVPHSIMNARNQAAASASHEEQLITSRFNTWWTYSSHTMPSPPGHGSIEPPPPVTYFDYINVNGDITRGITGSTKSSEPDSCSYPWYPEGQPPIDVIGNMNAHFQMRATFVGQADQLTRYVNTCEQIRNFLANF